MVSIQGLAWGVRIRMFSVLRFRDALLAIRIVQDDQSINL